jgi:cell division protein ZapA (FtsZ GTPase activity inhibitor)
MAADKKNITINIRGKSYLFRTVADSRRVHEVETLVNQRLEELDNLVESERRTGVTDIRLLILVLLNIADEFLDYREQLVKIRDNSLSLLEELELEIPKADDGVSG